MQQNTPEWLEWRRLGLGASEMAAVMGVSPYATPMDVWKDKTGRAKAFEGNAATQRGTDNEQKARAQYELMTMEFMPPAIATHPKYQILRASLDGLREDGKLILEIKCPGEETHMMAKDGKIPDHYMIQIQQQLLVTGADLCHYYSFNWKDETGHLVEVKPDLEMQGKIVNAALDFWKLVDTDTPPPLTDRDFKIVEDDIVKELCQNLLENKIDVKKEGVNELKAKIINLAGHPKVICGKVKLSTVNRNGKFSFHKLTIMESENV